MRKINQYLPFILWSTATIILTVIAFVALPLLIVYKMIEGLVTGNTHRDISQSEESDSTSQNDLSNSLIA